MTARRVVYGGLGVGLLAVAVLLLGAWQAAGHLRSAQDRLPAVRAALVDGDVAQVRAALVRLQDDTGSARRATAGPLWSTAAALPWLGDTPGAVRETTRTVDDLARRVLPPLADAAEALSPERLVRDGGQVDLASVTAAQRPLGRALQALERLPPPRGGALVVPALSSARADLEGDLERLRTAVSSAHDAARLLPAALGADGPRRYFVAFQTNAESRGTGGLVGAFALLTADRGRLSVPVIGDDRQLHDLPSRLDLGPDYRRLYGRDPELWANTNLSPHFPYAARRWLDVWQRHHGQRLDGALATDPVALGRLLEALGPVRLPDGEQVGADEVVRLTQWTAYERFEGREAERKDFLTGVARSVVDGLLDGDGDARGLVKALRRITSEGRLEVYSAHPEEQAALAGSALAGEVPGDSAPYAAVVVNNAAGNKLDYHLRREVAYELGPCADGVRDTVVRVRLRNAVPPGRLVDYASGRGDLPDGTPFERGSTRLNVAVYATSGAGLRGAVLDGVPTGVHAGSERGHPVFVLPVELARGQTRTLELRLQEPARTGPVRVPEQPLVRPQVTTVRDAGCDAAQVSRRAAASS